MKNVKILECFKHNGILIRNKICPYCELERIERMFKRVNNHERLIETLVQVQRYLESVEKYLPETQDREEIAYGITEALKKSGG